MRYVSEENLRNWFKEMEKKYPNSSLCEQVKTVENLMFDKFWKGWGDNLEFKEMKEEQQMRKLYCVFNAYGEIIGRFIDIFRANAYMRDYRSACPNEWISLRIMTVDEYYKYVRKLIDSYE